MNADVAGVVAVGAGGVAEAELADVNTAVELGAPDVAEGTPDTVVRGVVDAGGTVPVVEDTDDIGPTRVVDGERAARHEISYESKGVLTGLTPWVGRRCWANSLKDTLDRREFKMNPWVPITW